MADINEPVCVNDQNKCIICHKDADDDLIGVTDRGMPTLISCCDLRGWLTLKEYLLASPECVLVHARCRKSFTDTRKIKRLKVDDEDASSRMLRSSLSGFSWKDNCFFCCEAAVKDRQLSDVSCAMTLELRDSVLQCCLLRNDEWALQVKGRLEGCCDLVAEEAVYHRRCYRKFMKTVYRHSDELRGSGRPKNSDISEAFEALCDWLESSCEHKLYSLEELQQQMSPDGQSCCSTKHLKRKLIDRYGDHIVFLQVGGRHNVIGFRDMCSYILSEKWYADRKHGGSDESVKVVDAAAKLIAAEIRDMQVNVSHYPTPDDIYPADEDAVSLVPPLLRQLMRHLVPSKLKQESLCQAVVQCARPRSVLMPIPFGVAVSVDHSVGSKSLLQQLSHLGYCVSYDEVTRYKQSVVVSPETAHGESYPSAVTRWVADNVDHNVRTLDGAGTFHGMGMISVTVSPSGKTVLPHKKVARLQSRLTSAEIVHNKGISIVPYVAGDIPKPGLRGLTLKSVSTLLQPIALPALTNLNLLWYAALSFTDDEKPRPSWSGFMQHVTSGQHSSAAVVQMMPLIDMNPTDETCVHSTLLFAVDQAKQLSIPTPCITFDLPLWLKAVDIANAEHLDIVCCLGGFHLLMNFLGSIGTVMGGSGLEDVLRLNYGRDTVTHIMSGKAYARAVRSHMLIDGALMHKLISLLLVDDNNNDLPFGDCQQITADELAEIHAVYDSVLTDKIDVSDCSILNSASLLKLESCLNDLRNRLAGQSRTARLWLQYMYYVSVVKTFIIAERIGDWHLHLAATSHMLNLFAATGHHNYARCTRLYLQLMNDLPSTHPWLYDQFAANGFHAIRRSNRFWGGLSADLVIEQTMKKAIKGRSGLTHGRGMTENVRLLWVLSMHQCASLHLAMRSLTGLENPTDHHVETGVSRMKRDRRDMLKVVLWLDKNDPFHTADERLRCISTGLTASEEDCISCDNAEQIGAMMQEKVTGACVVDASFPKADQVRTLQHLGSLCHVGKQSLVMDGTNLFHRLIILVERTDDVAGYFKYELTAAPASLYKCGYMRKADKPALAKEMKRGLTTEQMPSQVKYVVDGGALLHRVRWLKNSTFSQVFQQYVSYVMKKYGNAAVVVFDGYDSGPTIKDDEHRRRTQKVGRTSPEVSFHDNMLIVSSQQSFLSNAANKARFIDCLKLSLGAAGCQITQASGDADTLIVSTALQIAADEKNAVAVVADDTDILVMLAYHLTPAMSNVYFVSEAQKAAEHRHVSIASAQNNIGLSACHQLLVVHALAGCDSTSAIYGRGKGTVLRKLTKSNTMPHTDVMQRTDATVDAVVTAGMELMLLLFDGKAGDSLNKLRHSTYCRLAATSLSRPQPEKLPPTERAAYFHILCVHLQAVRWKNLNDCDLDPLAWGWKLTDGQYMPIMTDLAAAPDDILNIVRCKCKTSCVSHLCSCRKNSLMCVSACSNCHGDCTNGETVSTYSDISEDSESEHEGHADAYSDDETERIYFDSDLDYELEEEVQ